MKKILNLALVGTIALTAIFGFGNTHTSLFTTTVYANDNEIKVTVNGEYVNFDVQPINQNGSVFVPIRAIFEALGYEVRWDSSIEMANATLVEDNYLVNMILGSGNWMNITYKEYVTDYTELAVAWERLAGEMSTNFSFDTTFSPNYQNINGRILVPVRAISEGTGASVKWDGATQTVIIDSSNSVITNPETGISYDVNNAESRVNAYFGSQNIDNNGSGNNSGINGNIIDNSNNQTNQELTREEKELEIVRLVNIERVNAGLNEVEIADDLMYVARWHADEMVELNYFSHTSPTYNLQHTQLAKTLGADYSYAGENAHAGSSTPEYTVSKWLDSSAHKAHILNPKHKYIGVGYSEGDARYGTYWSLFMGY